MRKSKTFSPTIISPSIHRAAEIPAGAVFGYGGRFLKVVRVLGTDPAAPVIVEEMVSFGPVVLAGQLSLWAADGVSQAMRRRQYEK